MGEVGEDPRWDKFAGFHDYLAKAFPLTQVSFLAIRSSPLITRFCLTDTLIRSSRKFIRMVWSIIGKAPTVR